MKYIDIDTYEGNEQSIVPETISDEEKNCCEECKKMIRALHIEVAWNQKLLCDIITLINEFKVKNKEVQERPKDYE